MPLPFILGLAVGAGAVVAFKNKDKLKDFVNTTLDKTKENVSEIKETICATKECIEDKKKQRAKEE
jgi:hypothetical protein